MNKQQPYTLIDHETLPRDPDARPCVLWLVVAVPVHFAFAAACLLGEALADVVKRPAP